MINKILPALILTVAALTTLCATAADESLPMIGAQVFIEPGQTAKDVDDWFRILEENEMTVCRIRMFETHMRKPDGTWDFSLYDEAFRAAERHHVKAFATLFPADETVGGFKYPKSEAHLLEIAEYVKQLVTHFKAFPALYGWVLQNEPGTAAPIRTTTSRAVSAKSGRPPGRSPTTPARDSKRRISIMKSSSGITPLGFSAGTHRRSISMTLVATCT